MNTATDYKVHPKENVYFTIRVVTAIIGYVLFAAMFFGLSQMPANTGNLLIFYAVFIAVFIFLRLGILIGYLKGNAIKVGPKQFPDIHKIVKAQTEKLKMNMPDVYILQSGGLLNAFATQFLGGKYVVLYSEIVEEAYAGNLEAVEFVIGHELGHIKRHHLTKNLLLFPSFIIPFLNRAYSRACEYTCDNIGAAMSPTGVSKGLLLLAAGKKLWKNVDRNEFILQMQTESGFWHWFAEKVSTHPHLNKRVNRFKEEKSSFKPRAAVVESIIIEQQPSDHSAFLPKN